MLTTALDWRQARHRRYHESAAFVKTIEVLTVLATIEAPNMAGTTAELEELRCAGQTPGAALGEETVATLRPKDKVVHIMLVATDGVYISETRRKRSRAMEHYALEMVIMARRVNKEEEDDVESDKEGVNGRGCCSFPSEPVTHRRARSRGGKGRVTSCVSGGQGVAVANLCVPTTGRLELSATSTHFRVQRGFTR